MRCPGCNSDVDLRDKFCSNCGTSLKKDQAKSDFELGRIEALHHLRHEFLRWLLGGFAVISGVSYFFLSQAVDTAIDSRIQTQKTRIEKAEEQSYSTTARAQVRSEELDKKVADLDRKANELGVILNQLEKSHRTANEQLQVIEETKQRLVNATHDLESKSKALSDIIESKNAATIFAKLRSDLYRIRTLTARTFIRFRNIGNEKREVTLPPVDISLIRTRDAAGQNKESNLVQFTSVGNTPTELGACEGSQGVLVRQQMFTVYDFRLFNKTISALDGVGVLEISFGALDYPRGQENSAAVKAAVDQRWAFIDVIEEIEVFIVLNDVILNQHKFIKQDIPSPDDSPKFHKDGTFRVWIRKDVQAAYANTTKTYETHFEPTANP